MATGGPLDVTDVLRRLLRLRLAVAGVLAVAVAVAGVAYFSAGSSRQSRVAVVVVPPKVADVAGGDNPLLSLDNNLAQLAVVLSGSLGSESVGRALVRDGATAEFTVTTVTGDNPSFSQLSPQLIFTVTGADDAVTLRTAAALVRQSGEALLALQNRAKVPAASRATVVEVSAPTQPVEVAGSKLRSAGALGVGIVVLGLVLVLAVDALRRRRTIVPATGTTRADPPAVQAAVGTSPAVKTVTSKTANGKAGATKSTATKGTATTSTAGKNPATKNPATKSPARKSATASSGGRSSRSRRSRG